MTAAFKALEKAFHALAFILILGLALGSIGYTIACAVGVAPWLTFEAQFGQWTVPQAGMYAQIALTVILASMFFFVPSSSRVMALEKGHREFRLSMNDVARAYHVCHTADRAGVFTMSSEFDQVRERIAFLRDHPDLEQLETDVMEVAAQMSQQSRHLADVYSDDKVRRAKEFLAQRQEEAEMQQARITEALYACSEVRKWTQQVELEESVVASQLEQLKEQLAAALPELGYELTPAGEAAEEVPAPEEKIVAMHKPAAE